MLLARGPSSAHSIPQLKRRRSQWNVSGHTFSDWSVKTFYCREYNGWVLRSRNLPPNGPNGFRVAGIQRLFEEIYVMDPEINAERYGLEPSPIDL